MSPRLGMPLFRTAIAVILAFAVLRAPPVTAISVNYRVVNIVGLPGGGTQSLPISYVQTFPRWQFATDNDGRTIVKKNDVTAGRSNINLSLDWSPTLQVRPALDFLIKSGIPTYVMAGLQLQQSCTSNNNNNNNNKSKVESIPLARQWTTFGLAVEPNFRIEVFQHADNDVDDAQKKECEDSASSVVAWAFGDKPAQQLQAALESLGVVLSQLGEGSELLDGFHILSIPLGTPTGWVSVPQPTSAAGKYRVSCLATAEPDAETLLTIDQDLLEMTASSLLDMTVVGTATSKGDEEL